MNGEVPDIYWFVFWAVVFALMFAGAFWGGYNTHRVHMKVLEILRMYAEKGIEPPPSVMEPLAKQLFPLQKEQAKKNATRAGVYLGQFVGGVTSAALAGGFAWWWMSEGYEPKWVVVVATIAAVVFAGGAIAQLVAAIVTRDKDG
jgi:hypothetical protein